MNRIQKMAAGALVAAGISIIPIAAQQAAAGNHAHRSFAGGQMMGRFAAALNLTDAQKETAKQLFADGRQQTQPIVDQLKQVRTDMQAAVKANNTAQIASLAAKEGQL